MNRQLVCLVTPEDDAVVLTDELVQHEFIAALDHANVCSLIEEQLALARKKPHHLDLSNANNNNDNINPSVTSNGLPESHGVENAPNNLNLNNRHTANQNSAAATINGTTSKLNTPADDSSININSNQQQQHHNVMNGSSPHRSSTTGATSTPAVHTTNNNSNTSLVNGRLQGNPQHALLPHHQHNSSVPR
jgi:hypothetical protein